MEQSETTPQVEIQPVAPKPAPHNHLCCSISNCKCNTLLYCLAAFFILVILSGIAYLYSSRGQSPAPQTTITQREIIPTPTLNPASDWKTYTNTEYGFEFNYPSNWTLNQELKSFLFSSTKELVVDVVLENKNDERQCGPAYCYPTVDILTPINITSLSSKTPLNWVKGFFVENKSTTPSAFDTLPVKQITIDNFQSVRVSYLPEREYVFIFSGNNVYPLILGMFNNDDRNTYYPYFDQILSTFKFLDQPTPTLIP